MNVGKMKVLISSGLVVLRSGVWLCSVCKKDVDGTTIYFFYGGYFPVVKDI